MRTIIVSGHEVTWDGRTVWVNSGENGASLARFSRIGIDVHRVAREQALTGDPCLACSNRGGDPLLLVDWRSFQSLMREHHGVAVPDAAMPDYLKEARS